MKETIIVTELEYQKAKHIFESIDEYNIVAACEDEEEFASAVSQYNSRAVIVGVAPYKDVLYRALKESSDGKGAIIARFGVGYDNINFDLAKENNIVVTNIPDLGPGVAEHTIFMLGALIRHIAKLDKTFREGKFNPITGYEFAGKTLVVAGFGKIGRRVARIGSFGFGMKVIAADIMPVDDVEQFKRNNGLEDYVNDIDKVLPFADFVSVNMAATDKTHHFFDSERFSKFKEGSFIVNTARGRLIDEQALFDALVSGHLGGAAIDVFENEPYVPMNPEKDLRKLDNVILTPHVASNTFETNERMARGCIENISNFFAGRLDKLTRIV